MLEPPFLTHFQARRPEMIAELRRLVELESPSRDKAALDALGRVLAGRLGGLGGSVQIVPNEQGGDHVLARFQAVGAAGPPALVLGHFDTVWPLGTLARMPFRVNHEIVAGPGVYDMKSNIVLLLHVLEFLGRERAVPPRGLTVLFTSDEEIGSPRSRPLIERLAGESALALVLEPPLADGSLKTARKGVGRFTLEIEGRAAHAGVAPQDGVSAIVELAHQVLRIQALNDPDQGITVNVGVIQGGTTPNVVPAQAVAQVDVRVETLESARAVERSLRSIQPVTPGTRVRVEGEFTRPPMERTAQSAALFTRAREIARDLGIELTEGSTGGGSDGNFTAALGLPTLDGLGALGGGAHADHEHVLIDSLPVRSALLAALLLNL